MGDFDHPLTAGNSFSSCENGDHSPAVKVKSQIMPGPSKNAALSAVKGVDEQARLAHIQTLWEQLARLRENSIEYKAMIRQIRKEADAFRKLVESRPPTDREEE